MGEAYDSLNNLSTNTKDEVVHEGMREEEEPTSKYLSDKLKKNALERGWCSHLVEGTQIIQEQGVEGPRQ